MAANEQGTRTNSWREEAHAVNTMLFDVLMRCMKPPTAQADLLTDIHGDTTQKARAQTKEADTCATETHLFGLMRKSSGPSRADPLAVVLVYHFPPRNLRMTTQRPRKLLVVVTP
jgi:hypothetical protein